VSALLVAVSVAAAFGQQGRSQPTSRFDLTAAAGGVVTSVDPDGVPRFVVATDTRSGPLAPLMKMPRDGICAGSPAPTT
jgi:hypothetical protein